MTFRSLRGSLSAQLLVMTILFSYSSFPLRLAALVGFVSTLLMYALFHAQVSSRRRALQMAQGNNAAGAVASKAFGGSRHGLVEAETNRAFLDEAGRTTAAPVSAS